jgi:ankyrin repeat protein
MGGTLFIGNSARVARFAASRASSKHTLALLKTVCDHDLPAFGAVLNRTGGDPRFPCLGQICALEMALPHHAGRSNMAMFARMAALRLLPAGSSDEPPHGTQGQAAATALRQLRMKAAEVSTREVMALLFAGGDHIEDTDDDGYTALMLAAWCENDAAVAYLLEHGADPLRRNRVGLTASLLASGAHLAPQGLAALFSSDVDVNHQCSAGDAPLHRACRQNRWENVRYLLAHGADTMLRNQEGATGALVAARGGQLVLAAMALGPFAQMNDQDSSGNTLLHHAANTAACAVALRVLVQWLDDGASPHLQNHDQMTPLMLIILNEMRTAQEVGLAVAAMLAVAGNLDLTEQCGNSAFLFACDRGTVQTVRRLHQAGARCDGVNHFQQTALMLAAHREPPLLAFLLKQNLPINAQDSHGNTALHYACTHRNVQSIALLLEHGANWRLGNFDEVLPDAQSTDPAVLALFAAWTARQALLGVLGPKAPGGEAAAPRRCGPAS